MFKSVSGNSGLKEGRLGGTLVSVKAFSPIGHSTETGAGMVDLLEDGIDPEAARVPANAGRSVCTLKNQHIDLTQTIVQ